MEKALVRRRRPKSSSPTLNKGMASEAYFSKAITRALDVLESFPNGDSIFNLREISQRTDMPESSLFRVLVTLEARGYLRQNPDGTYQLSPKVLWGRLREHAEQLRQLVDPHLHALCRRFNETASLAYLFGDKIEVLDVVETFHEIRHTNKVGRILPPHASSLGKSITAFQERTVRDQILEVYGLIRRTEKTIVDRHTLQVEFEQVRNQGYAYDRGETAEGGFCIGAPIIAPSGEVFAAISVSTPMIRMTPEREQEMIQALLETTRQVSKLMK